MLNLHHVCKSFSGIPAVDGISFTAHAGEVTGYLGPNGSGKSTTMKMITLMSLPTLEEIFSQLAVEHDTAAISREIADLILA